MSPQGLLLFSGDILQSRDFISLTLIDGRVEFRFDLGSGSTILISDPIALNVWHTALATRTGRTASLQVDGEAVIPGMAEGLSSQLNMVGDLFIGGVADYSTVSQYAGTEAGFIGCIQSLQVSPPLAELAIFYALDSSNKIMFSAHTCMCRLEEGMLI